jgi:hypothetical protein
MRTIVHPKAFALLLMAGLLTAFFTFSACTDQGKENARKSLDDFKAYVKEHKDATVAYMDQEWDDMQMEFDRKKAELDKNMNKMDNEMKKSYEEALADWETFKADYQVKRSERNAEKLRATIVPSDIHTDLSNVTSKNIAAVFEHFVNTVDNNKETYSKEEWVSINNYWKSLNDLAGKMDDDHKITREDSRKMDALRLKYGAIKVLNKPFAESENK